VDTETWASYESLGRAAEKERRKAEKRSAGSASVFSETPSTEDADVGAAFLASPTNSPFPAGAVASPVVTGGTRPAPPVAAPRVTDPFAALLLTSQPAPGSAGAAPPSGDALLLSGDLHVRLGAALLGAFSAAAASGAPPVPEAVAALLRPGSGGAYAWVPRFCTLTKDALQVSGACIAGC
jgi:hypothetical protein